MTDRIYANEEKEVPLFLLPHAIAKQIKKTGDRIYRISVKRTHWHHYNVSVRTKSPPKELLPGRGSAISSGIQLQGCRGAMTGTKGGSSS